MSATILLILRLLLALSLYVFLAWALWTLWRDLKGQSVQLSSRKQPAITLHRQDEDLSAAETFSGQEVFIGRDPACHCYLDDSTISAKHARLFYLQGQWWVEDLHSTNGTYLNQVEISSPLVLSDDDLLRCGGLALKISISQSKAQPIDRGAAEEFEIFE